MRPEVPQLERVDRADVARDASAAVLREVYALLRAIGRGVLEAGQRPAEQDPSVDVLARPEAKEGAAPAPDAAPESSTQLPSRTERPRRHRTTPGAEESAGVGPVPG